MEVEHEGKKHKLTVSLRHYLAGKVRLLHFWGRYREGYREDSAGCGHTRPGVTCGTPFDPPVYNACAHKHSGHVEKSGL